MYSSPGIQASHKFLDAKKLAITPPAVWDADGVSSPVLGFRVRVFIYIDLYIDLYRSFLDHSFHVPSRRSTRHTGAPHDVEKLPAIRGRPRPVLEDGRVGDLHGPAPVVSARVTKLGDGYVGLGAKNR